MTGSKVTAVKPLYKGSYRFTGLAEIMPSLSLSRRADEPFPWTIPAKKKQSFNYGAIYLSELARQYKNFFPLIYISSPTIAAAQSMGSSSLLTASTSKVSVFFNT